MISTAIPYRNLTKVDDEAGYDFSPEDLKELKSNDFVWEQASDNPVILVITVCRLVGPGARQRAGQLRRRGALCGG